MRTAFIIDNGTNESLLRFTETKLFFDANNQGINFVNSVNTVSTLDEAVQLATTVDNSVILFTGDFLTTTFRNKHANTKGMIIATEDPDVIKFDSDTYVGFKKKSHYTAGSKQLYIIENLLKTCLRNQKLIYLENTEDLNLEKIPKQEYHHLVGLASGWKTIELANRIGFENLRSITVYDRNIEQLTHAQWLHSHYELPDKCPMYKNVCGIYSPTYIDKEVWKQWHRFPVNFKQINLFDIPVFPACSLIWISNVFHYEPNIFDLGWEKCNNMRSQLIKSNKDSTIL
jgi:hypothetical protein